MIKACIFDIDGTLLDTLHSLSYVQSQNMKLYGYGEIDLEHTKLFVGDGYEKFVERSLLYSGDKDLLHYEAACKTYRPIFAQFCQKDVQPYSGMIKALHTLKEQKIVLGVLSNKPQAEAEQNINHFFQQNLFYKVYGERPGIPRKPDPAMLKLMLKELNILPEDCMYLGDTDTDMKTGIGAGTVTVGITWGFRSKAELLSFSPAYILEHPDQIPNLIQEHNQNH